MVLFISYNFLSFSGDDVVFLGVIQCSSVNVNHFEGWSESEKKYKAFHLTVLIFPTSSSKWRWKCSLKSLKDDSGSTVKLFCVGGAKCWKETKIFPLKMISFGKDFLSTFSRSSRLRFMTQFCSARPIYAVVTCYLFHLKCCFYDFSH